jgi:two-component system, LytTR family, response regulator
MQPSSNYYDQSEPVRLNCIAVDDEPIALNVIKSHVERITWLRMAAVFRSANSALDFLRIEKIDLVFLDINMPDLSGLEMAGMIDSNIRVIFTTAYPEFAIEGFEMAATDYLLKPISFERLLKACDRARAAINSGSIVPAPSHDNIYFKDGYNWIRINTTDLVYLEAADNYVLFHGAGKPVMVRITLSEAMSRLADKGFIRVHKSFGVALSKVERIDSNAIIAGESNIPLSKSYRDELLRKIQS